jgi:hypothetical protein
MVILLVENYSNENQRFASTRTQSETANPSYTTNFRFKQRSRNTKMLILIIVNYCKANQRFVSTPSVIKSLILVINITKIISPFPGYIGICIFSRWAAPIAGILCPFRALLYELFQHLIALQLFPQSALYDAIDETAKIAMFLLWLTNLLLGV